MDSRTAILGRILDHLPIDPKSRNLVTEEAALAEYGVASLHLITLLLNLQREFGLGGDTFMDVDMPSTVGELVSLIQDALRRAGATELPARA